MRSLPPQEPTNEQRRLLEAIPALPNPYYDWLKLATKNATDDRHVAAATEAVLQISEERSELIAALKLAAKGCLRPNIYPKDSDEAEQILAAILRVSDTSI